MHKTLESPKKEERIISFRYLNGEVGFELVPTMELAELAMELAEWEMKLQ